jgi:hypothetical protein
MANRTIWIDPSNSPQVFLERTIQPAGNRAMGRPIGAALRTFSFVLFISAGAMRPSCDGAQNVQALVAEPSYPDNLPKQVFDQLAYGSQRSAAGVHRLFDVELRTELQAIDEACGLLEHQRAKLRLAAQGDRARYFRYVESLRREICSPGAGLATIQSVRLLPTTMEMGVCGDESLFRKTLRGLLTDEQRSKLRTVNGLRRRQNVEQAVHMIRRGAGFPLSDERGRVVVELLLKETDPPEQSSPYAQYIVLLRAGRLQDRLRDLLSASEWATYQQFRASAQRLVPSLRVAGMLPAEADEGGDDFGPPIGHPRRLMIVPVIR